MENLQNFVKLWAGVVGCNESFKKLCTDYMYFRKHDGNPYGSINHDGHTAKYPLILLVLLSAFPIPTRVTLTVTLGSDCTCFQAPFYFFHKAATSLPRQITSLISSSVRRSTLFCCKKKIFIMINNIYKLAKCANSSILHELIWYSPCTKWVFVVLRECNTYASAKCGYCCPLWLWNSQQTSPEVQNGGISGPTKKNSLSSKIKKKIWRVWISHL